MMIGIEGHIRHVYHRANQRPPRPARQREDASGVCAGALRRSASNGTIPTWPTAIRNTSGRAARGSSRHRYTKCFPSLKPVNQRCSYRTCADTSGARRLTLEMSRGLAQSGIEKWTVDTGRMTMAFHDKAGREMLVEQIS